MKLCLKDEEEVGAGIAELAVGWLLELQCGLKLWAEEPWTANRLERWIVYGWQEALHPHVTFAT